jgi:hypothetical protein
LNSVIEREWDRKVWREMQRTWVLEILLGIFEKDSMKALAAFDYLSESCLLGTNFRHFYVYWLTLIG